MENHAIILINITHISFFLVIIIATFFPLQSHSQPPSVNDYSTCKDIKNLYNCGNISNISYPFWGQNGNYSCGAGIPFYLHCNRKNITTILLSSQNFTVLEINTKKHTMKLKRTDLDRNLCFPQYNDTYFDPTLFQYRPNVKNITIYYNCTSSEFPNEESLCEYQNYVFYEFGNPDILLEKLRNCKKHIRVPIGANFSTDKADIYDYLKRDVLESGLDTGFEVKYSVNENCSRCLGTEEGECLIDYFDKHVDLCYYDNCSDGSIACSTHCPKRMFSFLFIS